MRFHWSECSAAVLIQHCIKIVFSSILEFYHNIWYWNPLLNQLFKTSLIIITTPTILQALFEMYLQYIPNDRNIYWRSFDSFSVYDIMLPYSWSTEPKYHFISKVVLALTLLIKSIFYILAITSNFSQRETTIALKVWFMVLFYYRTSSNACRKMLFNLLYGRWFNELLFKIQYYIFRYTFIK